MFNEHPSLWEIYLQKKCMEVSTAVAASADFLHILSIATAPGMVIGITGPPECGKSFMLAMVALVSAAESSIIIGKFRFLLLDSEGGFPARHLLARLAQKYFSNAHALHNNPGMLQTWFEVQDMDEFYVAFVEALKTTPDGALLLIDSLTRPLRFSMASKILPGNDCTLPANLKTVSCLIQHASKDLGNSVSGIC